MGFPGLTEYLPEMDSNDVSDDDTLLANLDMILLTLQKDVTRNTVLAQWQCSRASRFCPSHGWLTRLLQQ
jgi:hypothetical protein